MTRRDYISIAGAIAELRDSFEEGGACQFGVECVADALAVVFAEDNPRFDNERFRAACGIVGEAEPQVCEWFALCDHPATGEQPHPVLGQVPICDRCRAKVDAIA